MSKDKDKNNWFGGINFNPFHFKRNSYLPHYDTGADYNTNSKSYYDYLSRVNKILEMFKKFIIRLLNRDVKVEDTNTVKMKKEGDWIDNGKGCPPDNYDDEIILSAEVKRSKGKETLILNENEYEVGNALSEKQDGLFSPDYTELMEEFEASGGTNIDYSTATEQRHFNNIPGSPFTIKNSSKNKGTEEEHELWSAEYGNVLSAIDLEIGKLNDKVNDVIENPPEPDFGYVHQTMLPQSNIFYSYYDFSGELIPDNKDPLFPFTLPSNEVDLTPGNKDIVISFTPMLSNPDKYSVEEVLFSELDNGTGGIHGRIGRYRKNTEQYSETFISTTGELVSGRRYHMRMSDRYTEVFSFSGKNRQQIHAVLKNRASGATYKPWQLDGDKPIPTTEDELKTIEFYMKDVEIRVVNQ